MQKAHTINTLPTGIQDMSHRTTSKDLNQEALYTPPNVRRFIEAEPIIKKDRWLEAEPIIKKDEWLWMNIVWNLEYDKFL